MTVWCATAMGQAREISGHRGKSGGRSSLGQLDKIPPALLPILPTINNIWLKLNTLIKAEYPISIVLILFTNSVHSQKFLHYPVAFLSILFNSLALSKKFQRRIFLWCIRVSPFTYGQKNISIRCRSRLRNLKTGYFLFPFLILNPPKISPLVTQLILLHPIN